MKFLTVATLATVALLSSGSAFAQGTDRPGVFKDLQQTAPSRPEVPAGAATVAQNMVPTAAQCAAGYQEGMSWTREEFAKACAKPTTGN